MEEAASHADAPNECVLTLMPGEQDVTFAEERKTVVLVNTDAVNTITLN